MRLGALSASTFLGDPVLNPDDVKFGKIDELMIDLDTGCIVYAVLSFGGFLGLGDKLFAIPWVSLQVDRDEECFRLDIDQETLEKAPGFDHDHWPEPKDFGLVTTVNKFYDVDHPFEKLTRDR